MRGVKQGLPYFNMRSSPTAPARRGLHRIAPLICSFYVLSMNRNDLVERIAASIWRQITWLEHDEARAIADGLLRDMKVARLRIFLRRE